MFESAHDSCSVIPFVQLLDFLSMAGLFKAVSSSLKELEDKLKFLEVFSLPLNFSKKQLIGEGSFSCVYKFHLRDKPAAVKKFKQTVSKKQMLKAVQSFHSLRHENVVRLRGYSLRPAALIFEYCVIDCGSTMVHNLKELITLFNDNDYHCFEERLNYVMQIVEGLQYLHQHKTVHRDMKPSNILVTGSLKDVVVKVADFSHMAEMKDTCRSLMTNHHLKGNDC